MWALKGPSAENRGLKSMAVLVAGIQNLDRLADVLEDSCITNIGTERSPVPLFGSFQASSFLRFAASTGQ